MEGLTLQDYKDLFRTIPLPEIADTYQDDETFAKLRVAGPNPMAIHGVTKEQLIELIGEKNCPSDAVFNTILGTTDDSVEDAGQQGRLCVTNYNMLTPTKREIGGDFSFVVDPIAVFAEPKSDDDTIEPVFIKPIGIQMGQDSESEFIAANTEDIYRWLMAKSVVNSADAIHHELVSHLGYTHLVMEPISIATQQHIPADHPLGRLLMPHIEGTNFINREAATSLLASDGPIDRIMAHTDDRLRSLQGLAVRMRSTFDFRKRMLDAELKSRKIDKLKVFPYRDDARLLWKAIHDWSEAYVTLYYACDQEVEDDAHIQAWSRTLMDSGDIANFDRPRSKEDLTNTLAMIIFTASAQHAAINFPQQKFMSFAPAMPGLIWDNFPNDGFATEEDYLKILPSLGVAEQQLNTLYLLGSIRYRPLGTYESNEFPYRGTLEPKARIHLEKFRSELKKIEDIIYERNKDRGSFGYEFLLPSKIPASINI